MTEVKLELLTDIDILLMVEKGTKGGICHSIQRHAKANNKYMKNQDKNKESSYLMYLDANNLYGCAMSQKLPVGDFKWKKTFRNLMKTSQKIMMKIVIKDIFLKQMLNNQKNVSMFMVIFHFQQKVRKSKNVISLFVI